MQFCKLTLEDLNMTKAQLKKKVQKIVDNFEIDNQTDYQRMDAQITEETGLSFDNKSIWALVNRAKASVERISFSLDD